MLLAPGALDKNLFGGPGGIRTPVQNTFLFASYSNNFYLFNPRNQFDNDRHNEHNRNWLGNDLHYYFDICECKVPLERSTVLRL
jgi:hypothetical protein